MFESGSEGPALSVEHVVFDVLDNLDEEVFAEEEQALSLFEHQAQETQLQIHSLSKVIMMSLR